MTNYRLGELLGRGGMGQVHAAQDRHGRAVVVKRLRNTLLSHPALSLHLANRLSDEGQLLGRIIHHNVVRVRDRGVDADGQPFLVMDHAAGVPLNRLIDRDGALSVQRSLRLAAQLIAGLAAIHEAGIIHADLKASNLLVDDNDRLTIIDFGLARSIAVDSTDDTLAGTPAYMAPEVISGAQPTVAADIYAVGIILYEMLTDRTPFAGASDIFSAHVHDPVVPPSLRAPHNSISLAVDRLVLRALAKTPEARYHNVRELAIALDDVLAAELMATTVDVRELMARADSIETRKTVELARTLPAVALRRPEDPHAARTREVIASALVRAQASIEKREGRHAIAVLEEAIAGLVPDLAGDLPMCAEVWRLETVLAALYNSIGRTERARRVAMSAYRHALHTNCDVAKERTKTLLERLEPAPRPLPRKPRKQIRLARGSAQFTRR